MSQTSLNSIILDLSLASSLPTGAGGANFILAAAAANALACRTDEMQPRELRELEYTVIPLLALLTRDIDDPVAAKAAYGIRSLMRSRLCMSRFLSENGLSSMTKILDILLGGKMIDLHARSPHRSIVEYLSICYRELARFYPWLIVKAGALRHLVTLLRFGDVELQTIASASLASLSTDLEICKQMFSNGAIKPLINVSDGDVSNEACMLAGLGCVVQLCRIPEIAVRVVQQGALPLLEKALHRKTGYGVKAIREKALYSLAWLSRVPSVKSKICSKLVLKGMKRELKSGTMPARYTIVQMLLNLNGTYDAQTQFCSGIKDILLGLLKIGAFHERNLVLKAICVLYKDNDSKMYFVEHGLVESIYDIIGNKSQQLQEVTVVTLLNLCAHPDIPKILLKMNCQEVAAKFLYCTDDIIRELAIVLLKTLFLYNNDAVDKAIPPERMYMMRSEDDLPSLYGSEYGGMIEEFLQRIVENRRDMQYLLEIFEDGELEELQLSPEQLTSYQNTFIELDFKCSGKLELTELKMLMIMLGEVMDVEELQGILDEYDSDKSGSLDFREFAIMMKGWSTRFGSGLTKVYNEATKRGAVGKARRHFDNWMARDALEAAQIEEAKQKRLRAAAQRREMELKFCEDQRIENERHKEIQLREAGYRPDRFRKNPAHLLS